MIKGEAEVEQYITRATWLDGVADNLQGAIRGFFRQQPNQGISLRNFLHGVWLGHPLHAALTDLPVGAWSCGIVLDYLGQITGDGHLKRAGDYATGIGVVGAVAAAATGLADYSEVYGEQRRIATVHGILNSIAALAYVSSLVRRFTGDRGGAVFYASIGYAIAFFSADLGGLMSFRYGTMVNREAWVKAPSDWRGVMMSADLPEGQTRAVHDGETHVLLARVGGQVYAIDNVCTHWGCPLDEGHLEGTSIVCPCHGSRFDLTSGQVIDGPATAPAASFAVQERNGQIEIRMRHY